MLRPEPGAVRRVTCVGGGVIGGGWAAHFLARGYDVTVQDPDPAAEDRLCRLIDAAWPSLETLGLAQGAAPDRLHFTTDLATAVAEAEFVQESAPEDLTLKQRLYAELGDLVPPAVVISSSTSGLAMSDIQARCATPGRTVVGHPFNPPYLLPLVEVVGGARTDREAVDWTVAFYSAAGKRVLRMVRELPGFIATRLQEAIWREALHMVAAGEATVEQIDAAITDGPGLRWAFMGPCLTFHVGGGEGGMAHNLDHFGPALKEPWTRLEAPELTEELRDRMVAGCDREAAGRSFTELVRERDARLVAIMRALRACRKDTP